MGVHASGSHTPKLGALGALAVEYWGHLGMGQFPTSNSGSNLGAQAELFISEVSGLTGEMLNVGGWPRQELTDWLPPGD